jgi:hypothetical protein
VAVWSNSSAGGYADRRYRTAVRAWRARVRALFLLFFGLPAALGIAGLFVFDGRFSWIAGLISGLCLGAWLAFREAPPGYIENWREGAEAERRTARALRRLDALVVHDVQRRFGNYDHLLVAPSGVYMIETKDLKGEVTVNRGVISRRRRHDPTDERVVARITERALGAAAELSAEIQRRSGMRTWVQAVVVFWCDFPQGVLEDERCVFIGGEQLADWIARRPSKLSDDARRRAAAAVEELADHRAA